MARSDNRAVVLLSSGLDSTVNLYETLQNAEVSLALTIDYGQRAARKEIEQAAKVAEHAKVPHKILELPWFRDFTQSSLVNREAKVPQAGDVSIDDMSVSGRTAKAVWVPNRNGILLNVAAAYAEGLNANWVVPGFNAEEAATFPDNSEDYLQSLTHAFSYSTANKVEVRCFTTALDKTAIVKRGLELEVPFEHVWPCYFSESKPCEKCESCQRFKRAWASATGKVPWV